MENVVKNTASAFGCEGELEFNRIAKAVINDDTAFDVLEETVKDSLKDVDFQLAKSEMIGEDFSEYGKIAPCVFTHLGADGGYPLHSCHINFKEEAMLVGMEVEVQFALHALEYVSKKD